MADSPAGDPRLLSALARVDDPEIRRPITELDMIRGAEIDGAVARIRLALTIVGCPAADTIERDVRAAAAGVEGVEEVDLEVGVMTVAERESLVERLRGTRRRQFTADSLTKVYAITSGKGGVGKSTVTANLAVALAARGLRVGLVDADVFGYSIPAILGLGDAKPTRVGDMILPPVGHGVKVISIGMFVDGSAAVSWRGPLLHRTMEQFLTDVFFGDLDVLLLDLPPGTGDVAISLGQLLPHAEVLVVTTPQEAAADVAERSGLVARQTGQTVIGVVENMAGLAQPDGSVLELFGSGGGDEVARRLEVPVLARLPLSVPLREGGDAGTPVVLADPADPAAAAVIDLAAQLAVRGRGLVGRSLPFSTS
ncbi:Mrp/NBP35 family ATP-binding protein [Schumannella luteola]|uniref:Iron-sulfur cluster carrier protein n=1 Tax=Schumannella luteola TaxID=472059 RepID=A0A852YDW5_9MICO|nr:Mrp/NBP35 family ATP-binding protein [Schumannella luteola]NYG99500.1 ATP-binding protein involved in chromosome partitioning [Schumannella luteola]TPX03824.1 Mrp/NBP35 family ATP-binding protein [Schumannella luteola]